MAGTKGPFLSRRMLVAGGLALPLAVLAPPPLRAAAIPPSGVLRFTVLRGGSPMGTHRIAFRQEGRALRVDIAIDIAVRFGPIPIFRYTHRNSEIWEDGRLRALDARTDDNGEIFQARARGVPGGLRVEGAEGGVTAPADIIPTSYWNVGIVRRPEVLDTQRGILRTVTSRRLGEERIEAAGRSILAERWRLEDTLPVDLWYSRPGQFVRLAFEARGASIECLLEAGPPEASALAPGF